MIFSNVPVVESVQVILKMLEEDDMGPDRVAEQLDLCPISVTMGRRTNRMSVVQS